MIPRTDSTWQSDNWQHSMREAFRDPIALLDWLDINPNSLPQSVDLDNPFATLVPREFVQRMQAGDVNDPLLKQVLPLHKERETPLNFVKDPLQEQQTNPVPGLLHKYHGRVLLMAASNCVVNCRYCFRRHFPYQENRLHSQQLKAAIAYIASDPNIEEVILSGGDPLALGNQGLQQITDQLKQIPHIKRLRIHTRVPILVPKRIDQGCLQWLHSLPWPTIFVLHCNHPNEIDVSVVEALDILKQQGVTLLNQAVLLAGINDTAPVLNRLSERLFEAGVLPYYLHLLDAVAGAAHFDVDETSAKQLIQQMQARLPGYLVPKLVREIPEAPSKTPVV